MFHYFEECLIFLTFDLFSGHIAVVIAFSFGAYSEYISYPIFAIACTILFDVIFFFFPETPIFLLKQNKITVSS